MPLANYIPARDLASGAVTYAVPPGPTTSPLMSGLSSFVQSISQALGAQPELQVKRAQAGYYTAETAKTQAEADALTAKGAKQAAAEAEFRNDIASGTPIQAAVGHYLANSIGLGNADMIGKGADVGATLSAGAGDDPGLARYSTANGHPIGAEQGVSVNDRDQVLAKILAGKLADAQGRDAASRYGADQRLAGDRYSADQRLRGEVQSAGIAAGAARYGHDQALKGTEYTADQNLKGKKYETDNKPGQSGFTEKVVTQVTPGQPASGGFFGIGGHPATGGQKVVTTTKTPIQAAVAAAASAGDAMAQARQAIAAGADPAAVRQRLISMGVNPAGL